jgi:hypothetical protein
MHTRTTTTTVRDRAGRALWRLFSQDVAIFVRHALARMAAAKIL